MAATTVNALFFSILDFHNRDFDPACVVKREGLLRPTATGCISGSAEMIVRGEDIDPISVEI